MSETDKITSDEMVAMFGTEMPIEAVMLLWSSPADRTIGEIRARLRQIGAKRAPPPQVQERN